MPLANVSMLHLGSMLKADRYEIEQEIGRGGMGRVYRARDTRLGRTVALKTLPAELTHDAELRRRLAQEARAASALNHPGIATVYDYLEADGECFIVYEYVEGVTLRERLNRQRPTTDEVLELAVQLADSVAAAHDRGVVHRDLKPENIMLTPGPQSPGRTKILDFGLAKILQPLTPAPGPGSGAETASLATAKGLLVGTVNYMAPEQLEGESADNRADIHALGVVLYELATGINPFLGKTTASTIANILKQEAAPVGDRHPAAPAELDRILHKCLRKRREERYQSARELLVDFSNLRRDLASPARPSGRQAGSVAAAEPIISRRLARALLLLIQAGFLATYVIFFYHFTDRELEYGYSLPGKGMFMAFLLASIVATPVRLYLFTAVAFDYPDLGRKYRFLFPPLLLVDFVWAAVPLLLWRLGLLFVVFAAATLAYLPFSSRWLVNQAYLRCGGRVS